jgi:hypothetical protein
LELEVRALTNVIPFEPRAASFDLPHGGGDLVILLRGNREAALTLMGVTGDCQLKN